MEGASLAHASAAPAEPRLVGAATLPSSSMTGAPLHLFNTLGRRLQQFRPRDPAAVRIYSCGPTVYAYQHIGNLRAYVFADTLRRVLEWKGFAVRHVVNITDVGHLTSDMDEGDDKVQEAARREGVSIASIVERYTNAFFEDLAALRVEPPERWARASAHVDAMIEFNETLEAKGYAYRLPTGLYFDTSQQPDYGKLAMLDRDGLLEGARIAPTPGKRNPTDFALWRASPPGSSPLMAWDSPWGPGIPGWHIECSTMSIKYLGDHFDIHTGGVDHIPVHHTNELAQSEAHLEDGLPWVSVWMHNEFINLRDAKMSKSTGDVLLLRDLTDAGYHPLVYRRLLLGAHYRSQTQFTWSALEGERVGLRRLLERIRSRLDRVPTEPLTLAATRPSSARGSELLDQFDAAVSDDLNTARGIAVVSEASRDRTLSDEDLRLLLASFERVLAVGLLDLDPDALDAPSEVALDDAQVEKLVKERADARQRGDYAMADEIRASLLELGVELRDTDSGTVWRPATRSGSTGR